MELYRDPRYLHSERARRSVIIVSQRHYGTRQVAATYPLFVSAMRVQRTKQHSLPRRSQVARQSTQSRLPNFNFQAVIYHAPCQKASAILLTRVRITIARRSCVKKQKNRKISLTLSRRRVTIRVSLTILNI